MTYFDETSAPIITDPGFWMGITIIMTIFVLFFLFFYFKRKKRLRKESLSVVENEVPYYRDIPFKNIEQAFYVANYYGISANVSDFIGSIILKWINEGKVEICNQDGKMIIDMRDFFKKESEFETDLYIKLLVSAKKDKMLEEEEFIEFFQKDEKKLFKMFEKLSREVEDDLALDGLITMKESKYGTRKIVISEELKQKALQLQGLKNFLTDFSTIEQREAISVKLWEEYLMYAQLLGIADKVESEFSRIYPSYNLVVKKNLQKLAALDAIIATLDFFSGIISFSTSLD